MTRTVVVCGGGISGMVVSKLLAPLFDKVILLEARRLDLAENGGAAVPQSRHVHHLLRYGFEHLTRIFETFEHSLRESGAERVDHSKEVAFFGASGLYPQRNFGITVSSQTRALLDRILFDELAAIPNVEVLSGAKILSVEKSDLRTVSRVTAQVGANIASFEGEMFVDCTGTSSSKTWYGCSTVGTDARYCCPVDLHYRSFESQRFGLETIRTGTKGLILPSTRHDSRFLVIMPIENGNYLVTTGGSARDATLMDDSVPDFIRSMCIGRGVVIDDAHLLVSTRIARFSQSLLYWNRFENWDELPCNVFPVGDAFTTISPLAGQGISLAVKQALTLAGLMPANGNGYATAQATYLTLCHAAVEPCWLLAVARESRRGGYQLSAPAGTSDRINRLLELEESAYVDSDAHRRSLLFRHYLGDYGL